MSTNKSVVYLASNDPILSDISNINQDELDKAGIVEFYYFENRSVFIPAHRKHAKAKFTDFKYLTKI